jgi:hypothetical protein
MLNNFLFITFLRLEQCSEKLSLLSKASLSSTSLASEAESDNYIDDTFYDLNYCIFLKLLYEIRLVYCLAHGILTIADPRLLNDITYRY